jgi:hypothetical protein
MTKERATFVWKVVFEPKTFFITVGRPEARGSSALDATSTGKLVR